MKANRIRVFIALLLVLLCMAGGTAWAAESWVSDPASGCKIGWASDFYTLSAASWSGPVVDGKAEGKGILTLTARGKDGKEKQGRGEVEFVAGLLEGKASIKWADGDSYEGFYRKGLKEGTGLYYFSSNGSTYEGEWKNGEMNGRGIQKDANGKVMYEGEWKNGEPVAAPLKADKILGIPWGASEEQAKNILKQRPNMKNVPYFNFKAKDNVSGQCYSGPFGDFNNPFIFVVFYQDKMYRVMIYEYCKEDKVMPLFTAVKNGLTERYGTPNSDTGKYLDEVAWWNLGGGYNVVVWIEKNDGADWIEKSQRDAGFAFKVKIVYQHQATDDLIQKMRKPNAGKDY